MSGEDRRSLSFAETITSRRVIGFGAVIVEALREATLTADLSEIESRYLRAIRVSIGPDVITKLSRESVVALRDCLNAALEATAPDVSR